MTTTTVKNRCKVCKKKVGINGFECKCDASAVFCDAHKFTFAHDCTLSSYEIHKKALSKDLIKVKANQFDRIAEQA